MSKILLVSDSPFASTGLGRMSKYFLQMMPEHEWIIYGAKHDRFLEKGGRRTPVYDNEAFEAKFDIISPLAVTGKDTELKPVLTIIEKEKPDYLLFSMDYDRATTYAPEIKELQLSHDFKWINYFPMDREEYFDFEVDLLQQFADINITITKFGVEKIKQYDKDVDVKQIYHPINDKEFPKNVDVSNARLKAKETVGGKDPFIVGTVNKSFFRKDPARLVKALSHFSKDNPDAFFSLHTKRVTNEGVNLQEVATIHGMLDNRLAFMHESMHDDIGVPQEILNMIYRSMDAFVSMSQGEGFGFTTVEALLCEVPVIAPSNTSFPELLGDGEFGYLIDTKNESTYYGLHKGFWPLADATHFLELLQHVKDNPEEAKAKAAKGREFVRSELNLRKVGREWKKILV